MKKKSVYDYEIFQCNIVEKEDGYSYYDNIAIVPKNINTSELKCDDEIFYYVSSKQELEALKNPNNGEDFYISEIRCQIK